MDKKFDLKTTILAIFNFLVCGIILLFKSPAEVPLFFSFNEKIAVLGSKWFLLASIIIPSIIAVFVNLTIKKDHLNFFLKMLFFVCLYENMLIMIYISATDSFAKGAVSEIPLSLIYFLPLSGIVMISAQKLKTMPYKSISPFRNKYSIQAEFIWKQAHIFAKDIVFAAGFFMVIATMIFAIFRLLWINLIVVIIGILIPIILTYRESKLMSQKRSDMQQKQDNLNKKKSKSEENKQAEN